QAREEGSRRHRARADPRRAGQQEPLRLRAVRAARRHRSRRVHLHAAAGHHHHKAVTLFPAWRPEWILHDDPDLIAVDKPPFVSTHAPEPTRRDDAFSRVTRFLQEERGEAKPYLGIHQRLDRDTSGVLTFTRRKEANRAVAEQFEGRHVKKTYVAAVVGLRGPERGMLRHKL